MRTADREALVEQLINAGRDCVNRGLVLASGGNLSVRLEGRGSFIITESGTWLDRLTPQDFAEISLHGGQRLGGRPSVEWKLHALTYAARPDVHAIIHLHPQSALLVDMLGEPIRMTTLDHQFYLRSIGRVDFLPSGSDELAEAAAAQATSHNAIVLAHHGSSALGETVEMALRRALNLEEAAQMTYRLLLAGNTTADFPQDYKDNIITA